MTNLTRIQDISWRDLGDHIIVLDSLHGKKVHHLEGVSSFIWKLLDGNHSQDQILEKICAHYDIDSSTAQNDLEAFLSKLESLKLISQ